MIDIRATKKAREHYPHAIKVSWFMTAFLGYTKVTLGLEAGQIAFLTSICSDDLNSVELPKTGMVGPFIQGGLDGYPFAGITGIDAFSHHLPLDGAAMMLFGPHIGISQSGVVGKVIRPGQKEPTACCGAAAGALAKLEKGEIKPTKPSAFSEDNYQQEKLEQLVLDHKDKILGAGSEGGPERFITMTELLFAEEQRTMTRLLTHVHFKQPTFLFGGILINEDAGQVSSIAFRSAGRVDKGKYEDLTEQFKKFAEPKFKELESGKADAFK